MRRIAALVVVVGFGALGLQAAALAGNTGTQAAATPDAPTVQSLAGNMDQFRWGQTHLEVIRLHNQTGGIFDMDYNTRLTHLQPGVQMQAVEAERDQKKKFFEQSWIQFMDTPTGFDNTIIKGEYTYRNHESVMYVDRNGRRRYFFFMGSPPGERLWKILDDVPLRADGALGRTFQEAVTKINVALSMAGRIRVADASKGILHTMADWQDGSSHLRAEDRGPSIALIVEEKNTLQALPQLRANKEVDPLAMDPSISAITRGGISDPNAARVGAADAGARRR